MPSTPMLVAFGALTLTTIAGLSLGVSSVQEHEAQRAALVMSEEDFTRLIETQTRLTASGLFTMKGAKDGQEGWFMVAPILMAEGASSPWTAAQFKPHQQRWRPIQRSIACKEAPDAARPKFLQCADQLRALDTSLITRLRDVDRITIPPPDPWRPLYAQTSPDFGALVTLAEAHLVVGAASANPLPAFDDVAHVARLLVGTEDQYALVTARELLVMHGAAVRDAEARGLLTPGERPSLSVEDDWAARGMFWDMEHILLGLGPPDALPRLLAEVPNPIGLCSAAVEAQRSLGLDRRVFTDPWPGELDHQAQLDPLAEVMDSGRCRTFVHDTRWNDWRHHDDLLKVSHHRHPSGTGVDNWRDGDRGDVLRVLVAEVPYVRQLVFSLGALQLLHHGRRPARPTTP